MIRYLKSYVKFKVVKGDGNRILNVAKNNNINIWEIRKFDNVFYAKCYKNQYLTLSRQAKKEYVRIKVVNKRGAIFKARKYKKRWGVLIGLCFLLATITFLQNFIFHLNLNYVGKNDIGITLDDFKEYGIKKGAFLPSLDFREIESKLYKRYSKISWISINRIGTKVDIEIRPRKESPLLLKQRAPCNVIAKRAGKILSIESWFGEKQVIVGDYVLQGDLLVSGIVDNADLTTSIGYSYAKVIALTEFTNVIKVNEINLNAKRIKELENEYEKKLGEIKIISKRTTSKKVKNQTIISTDYVLEENIALQKEIQVFS
jgi:similar to stage IV sporulation protein